MATYNQITDPTIKKLFYINSKGKTNQNLMSAFAWSESPEGVDFWGYVCKNPTTSFASIKHLLPKTHKMNSGYTKVKSLYKIAKDGMKFKAITSYGTEFTGIIGISSVGTVQLYNNKGIGYTTAGRKGYKYVRRVDKGGVEGLRTGGIKSISVNLSSPKLKPVAPKAPAPKTEGTYVSVTSIKGVEPGTQFIATINDKKVTGKIQKGKSDYFLCQNTIDGFNCKDKLGYKYSYYVESGSAKDLESYNVKNFKIVKPKPVATFTLNGGIVVKAGDSFTAKIGKTEVMGKVQISNGKIFLCQDEKDGGRCIDRLGYKYSWYVGTITHPLIEYSDVSYFKIVTPCEEVTPCKKVTSSKIGNLTVEFNEGYVTVNGVKITNKQLEGIAIAQGVVETETI